MWTVLSLTPEAITRKYSTSAESSKMVEHATKTLI